MPDGTVRQAHEACEEGIFRHGPTAHDEAPLKQQRWLGANWCRVPALLDAMARFDEVLLFLYLDTDAFLNNFRLPLDKFLGDAGARNIQAITMYILPHTVSSKH